MSLAVTARRVSWRPHLPDVVGRVLRAVARPVTPLGRIVLAVAIGCWVVAWRTGWEEFAVIAAAGVLAFVVAYGFTLGRQRLSVGVELDPIRVVVGDRAAGRLLVANSAGRRQLGVRLELPIGEGVGSFDIPSAGPGAEHEELFVVPTNRRAVIPVGPARSVRSDPLGIVRSEATWTGVQELFVHPKTTALEPLGAGFLRDLEGQTTQDLSSSDVAFHTLRQYVPGDDRRHIHWKTSARQGTYMVRQYVDTRQSHLAVLLSTDEAEYASADEFELAVSIAASLGLRALRDEQTVTAIAGGRPLTTATTTRLLDDFARIETQGAEGSLMRSASQAARYATNASIVALVTGSKAALADVRAAANRLSLHVRVLALRAAPGERASFRPVDSMTVLDLPALSDLTRTLWAVSRA